MRNDERAMFEKFSEKILEALRDELKKRCVYVEITCNFHIIDIDEVLIVL